MIDLLVNSQAFPDVETFEHPVSSSLEFLSFFHAVLAVWAILHTFGAFLSMIKYGDASSSG